MAELGPEWKRLRQLCLDKKLGGNDLPDAWLVAAVAQRGEHLVSFDRNFSRQGRCRRLDLLWIPFSRVDARLVVGFFREYADDCHSG